MDFKAINGYTEQLDLNTDVVNTCQDCLFSNHTARCSVNELHCVEGDTIVSVNGVCNKFQPVLT